VWQFFAVTIVCSPGTAFPISEINSLEKKALIPRDYTLVAVTAAYLFLWFIWKPDSLYLPAREKDKDSFFWQRAAAFVSEFSCQPHHSTL
jgi:hypothetical protein